MNKLLKVLKGQGENYILPFFWQHGETEEVLRTYMKVIHEANIGAVCVESRPHPDYCGPKWWEDMDVILDEARKRGMKVWILDDSHFPTGYANGAMAEQPLSLARKSICCEKYQIKGGETLELTSDQLMHPQERTQTPLEQMILSRNADDAPAPAQNTYSDDELLGFAAISDNGDKINLLELVTEEGLSWTAPAGEDVNWTIYKMNNTRNRGPHAGYINMIDFSSVRVLIDAVYEPHWDHYKDDFGKTIEGFFSDEPELGNGHLYDKNHFTGIGFEMDYPWSNELWNRLQEVYGEDLAFKLPLLWETEGAEDIRAQVRYDYMDLVSRLVEKNFSFQLGDWCRAHGVKYIGHLIEDNGQHARTGSTLGHFFRGLAGEDWGGIDDIGGQVYPMGEDDNFDLGAFRVRDGKFYHYMLGKLANSAAAIDSLKGGNAMCEIFGAYGWSEGVQLEKYLADHFMCRGINHFVPHAFSAAPFPDPDCPPHFYAHGHNPQYRHFGALMKYMNNVCELISDGVHKAPVAVIYPGEGEWTGKNMQGQEVGKPLCEAQIDYDFIPQDVFLEVDRYKTRIADNCLQVNGLTYPAVVVPYMQFITSEFARNIRTLVDAGVRVIFTGENYPEGIANRGKLVNGSITSPEDETAWMEDCRACELVEDLNALPAALADLADVEISEKNRYLHYYHYIHKDGMELYMLINEGEEIWKGNISLGGRKLTEDDILLYDAWDNCTRKPVIDEGKLAVEILPCKSLFAILPADPFQKSEMENYCKAEVKASGCQAQIDHPWKRSICESTAYPAFGEQKSVFLPDPLAEELPEFSGFVRYENSFYAKKGLTYILEITDAKEGLEIFVNGKNLGIQIVKPYLYDLTDYVKEGTNSLVIEVATTLERQMAKIPNAFGIPMDPPTVGSGIVGLVKLYRDNEKLKLADLINR